MERTELLVRSENKVFKGRSWLRDDKGWYMVGWARIMVVRDGRDPLFKGAFSINHDAHHIDFRKTIRKDHRKLDPSVDLSGDSGMIVFRDSDMSSGLVLQTRDVDVNSTMCPSDRLSFNNHPENAINKMILEPRTSGTWGGIDLFGDVPFLGRRGITKRQTSLDDDSAYGGFGNSAGVNLQNTIGSTKGCPTTRRVALIGIATDCTYTGAFDSEDEARENIIDLVNTAYVCFSAVVGPLILIDVARICTKGRSTSPSVSRNSPSPLATARPLHQARRSGTFRARIRAEMCRPRSIVA